MKKLILFIFIFAIVPNLSWASQRDGTHILKHIFSAENAPPSHEVEDIDVSATAAAAIRVLSKKEYVIAYEVDGVLFVMTLDELEQKMFEVPNTLIVFEENETGFFKGSVRLYLNINGSDPIPEAASVYIFVEGSQSGDTIRIKNVHIEYRGIS